MIKNLKAARLAADIADVPLIILARTDANAAKLITNDHDENDKKFLTGERSPEGFFYVKNGIAQAISRGLSYAPYSDLIWCETAQPNLDEAKNLLMQFIKNFLINCLLITAHLLLIGKNIYQTMKLHLFNLKLVKWVISFSLLLWLDSILKILLYLN